jgi:predicted small secreted protein
MNHQMLTRIQRVAILLCAAAFLGLGLTACQTVKGVGEDISNVGQAGEDAVNDD